jgi:hypothetical protein
MLGPANDALATTEAVRSASGGPVCLAAGCEPLTGRQTRACSDRHRVALSRQERGARQATRDDEIRGLLEAALRLLPSRY